jgi:AraC-like DNA-binding protein
VQAAFVHALLAEAGALGLEVGPLAARAGFAPHATPDPDARLPREVYLRLWAAVREQSADPAFALRMGALADARQMGVLGSVLRSCHTLREVGGQFARHARLLNSLYRVHTREEGGLYVYAYAADCPPALEREFVEAHLAAAVTLCRQLAGPDLAPVELRFRSPQPAHVEAYRRTFRAPLRFAQEENALVLAAGDLERPVLHRDRYAHALLLRHAAALLADLEREDGVRGRVQRHVLETLGGGGAGIEGCAAALGLSRRTLHRRLREEGTTFQALQEETRRGLALEYLARPDVPAGDVALLLGFSEPSAFHRAFRRWTGKTASQYRGEARGTARST